MSALRHSRFRRLLVGESVSSFGDSAMFLSLGVWAKDLTGSNTAAGLVFLFLTGPQLAAPLLGHLADRVRRRSLMIWSNVFGIALILSLLGVSGRNDLWRLYVVAVGYALLASVPARSGLLKDLLPSDDAASGQSLLSSVGQGTRILSPVIGTAIYATFGGGTLAVVDAATFAVAIVALLSIRVTESPIEETAEPFGRQLTAGFRYVHATRLLWQLTIALTAFLAVAGLLETGLFAAIQYGIHRPPSFYGVLLSVQGAGTIFGAVLASKVVKVLGEARTTGVGAIGAGVGMAFAIVAPSVPTFLIGMFVCGASLGLMFVAFGTAQQLYTPGRLTGRVGAASADPRRRRLHRRRIARDVRFTGRRDGANRVMIHHNGRSASLQRPQSSTPVDHPKDPPLPRPPSASLPPAMPNPRRRVAGRRGGNGRLRLGQEGGGGAAFSRQT
ncbi:MAG TPA: MFS transporter [Micromonosporaceae bacterium]|nr:MFS transporter [Micromonosporaceae bacterium]